MGTSGFCLERAGQQLKMSDIWLPISDWQDTIDKAAAFLPSEVATYAVTHGDLPDWVLLEKCHSFREWSFRYSVKRDFFPGV